MHGIQARSSKRPRFLKKWSQYVRATEFGECCLVRSPAIALFGHRWLMSFLSQASDPASLSRVDGMLVVLTFLDKLLAVGDTWDTALQTLSAASGLLRNLPGDMKDFRERLPVFARSLTAGAAAALLPKPATKPATKSPSSKSGAKMHK